jgi:PadR family transcriptional regulator, regulatory protein PadR
VTRRAGFSPQTLSVLAALCSQPSQWQHGYALAKETHLKSGTLYPILIRLAERGLVEAQWQDEPEPGRPRRHLYRLTTDGLAAAATALAAALTSKAAGNNAARRRRSPQPRRTITAVSGATNLGASAVPNTAAAPAVTAAS